MTRTRPSPIQTTLLLTVVTGLATVQDARAQTMGSCPQLLNVHKALECVEGVFSEPPLHLTLSSIPPGNGFPVGVVFEDAVHHIGSYKSLTDTTLAFVRSTNGSWYSTGSLTWLPPLHYVERKRKHDVCHQLGALCTKEVFGIEFYGGHRDLNTLSFYGLGSSSPDSQLFFEERETYGGIKATMPLIDWLKLQGQVEGLRPSLPASHAVDSVSNNFDEMTAPGLTVQPGFLHSVVEVLTDETIRAERTSDPLAASGAASDQPLMKSQTIFRFQNNAAYHSYHDLNTGHDSFEQFVFNGDESIRFGALLQRFVPPGSSWAVAHLCNGNKESDVCEFGTLDVKSVITLSGVGKSNVMPFYFQPTIGGSDIESQLSLRGFDNYRFRGRDAAFVQVEFGRTVFDPLGAFAFFDAGLVGTSTSDLWSSRARKDGGAGISVRLQGKLILQVFGAVGGGNGVKWGYNLAKLF